MTQTKERMQPEQRKGPQPFRLPLPPVARAKLREAGVYCQPRVFREYQTGAGRHVLKGVESGGAVREFGHYVVFCDSEGQPLPWLQPIQSIGANGLHAVVIAPSLVSVEVFRVQQTYDVLIAKHELRGGTPGQRLRTWPEILFHGRQGASLAAKGCGGRGPRPGGGRAHHAGVLHAGGGTAGDPVSIRGGGDGGDQGGGVIIGCDRALYAHATRSRRRARARSERRAETSLLRVAVAESNSRRALTVRYRVPWRAVLPAGKVRPHWTGTGVRAGFAVGGLQQSGFNVASSTAQVRATPALMRAPP